MIRVNKNTLGCIIILLLCALFSSWLTKVGFSDEFPQIMAALWIMVVSFVTIFSISGLTRGEEHIIVLCSLIIRISYMLIHFGVTRISSNPNLASDALMFWEGAIAYYSGDYSFNYGLLSSIVAYEFLIFGKNILCVIIINILLAMFTLRVLLRILNILDVSDNERKIALWIVAFLPYGIISCCNLLREPIYMFFLTLSFLYFMLHMMSARMLYFVFSLICVAFVLAFHTGYFPVGIVYFYFSIKYLKPKNSKEWTQRVIEVIIFVIAFVYVYSFDSMGYIGGNEGNNVETIINKLTAGGVSEAGSKYLTWARITSIPTLILYTPLRFVFYLTSPVPTNWRNISDISAFFLDSTIHIVFIVAYIKTKRCNTGIVSSYNVNDRIRMNIYEAGFWSVILSSLVFAMGTSAAGTAIRHRDATIGIEAIVIVMSMQYLFSSEHKEP